MKKLFATTAFAFVLLAGLVTALPQAFAGTTATAPSDALNVQLPGLTSYQKDDAGGAQTPANYINIVYKWSLGLAALLAMAQIVFGGMLYLFAAGNLYNQEEAKGKMTNALIGLVLLIAIALILNTINPKLSIIDEGKTLEETSAQ